MPQIYQLQVSDFALIGSITSICMALIGGAVSWAILTERVRRLVHDCNHAHEKIRELEKHIYKIK